MRFSTLDSICQALHCQPGDILEFVAAVDADDQPDSENVA
jgi:putative transcriptional regulator